MGSAQAFINALGFPQELGHLLAMIDRNLARGARFDAELLLSNKIGTVEWTVPSWAVPGDVSFFYCTTNWPMRVRRLTRNTIECADWIVDGEPATDEDRAECRVLLQSALDLFGGIGGTIFAVGQVIGESRRDARDRKSERLRDRIYAEIGRIWCPDPPIGERILRKHFAVGRRASITHVSPEAARAIIAYMAQRSDELPKWLANLQFGRFDTARISAENWRRCVSRDGYRVFSENELRDTFVNYVADVLRDGPQWYAECRCRRDGLGRTVADYMVPFVGKWLPIEAKLRMGRPDQAIRQVQTYLNANSFVPSIGEARGRMMSCETHEFGLIVDYDGIYGVGRQGFTQCDADHPLIARSELEHWTAMDIRERIRSLNSQ